ncbi:hypothetical protein T12_9950 [Trichinella patagoniensis]|uniref:Uncharacterized protein n=1 Tax=Trichinella patagoniensis TaxID=990121 RepID=A0A0V0ZFN2_9BILA|nr:hypothetical protein T12_9950 [Trichinella patagoniensis]
MNRTVIETLQPRPVGRFFRFHLHLQLVGDTSTDRLAIQIPNILCRRELSLQKPSRTSGQQAAQIMSLGRQGVKIWTDFGTNQTSGPWFQNQTTGYWGLQHHGTSYQNLAKTNQQHSR